MDAENFTQGMTHESAMEYDLGYGGLNGAGAQARFTESFSSLPSRPDYDGVLTLSEANQWYREENGQPLYVDMSKIDLSPVTINNLTLNKVKYVNFAGLLYPNLKTGLVYGTLGLTLLDKTGHVRIGNSNGLIDQYDFDYQTGRHFRNFATKIGNALAGKGVGYNIFGYGVGKVNRRLLITPF